MTKREKWKICDALELLSGDPGYVQEILESLVSLKDREEYSKAVRKRQRSAPIGASAFSYEKTPGAAEPKPERLVDRAAIERYHRMNPLCEICGDEGMKQPHHLLSVGLGGPDCEKNFLTLCVNHHIGNEGFHTLGMHRWFALVRKHLSTDALDKVLARLEKGLLLDGRE